MYRYIEKLYKFVGFFFKNKICILFLIYIYVYVYILGVFNLN